MISPVNVRPQSQPKPRLPVPQLLRECENARHAALALGHALSFECVPLGERITAECISCGLRAIVECAPEALDRIHGAAVVLRCKPVTPEELLKEAFQP